MLKNSGSLVCILLALAGYSGAQTGDAGSTCKFQTLQIQTDSTYVYGINNHGQVVGAYNPTSNSEAAFVWNAGTVTTIFYPNAAFTKGYGINDYGTVVGAYAATLKSADQGFKWANGKFTGVNYPGALATYPGGINIQGEIVGDYQDSLGVFHGFTFSGGTYTNLDYPGAASTLVSGINNNGEIVGAFTDKAGVEHGFVDQNGVLTQIDYPNAGNTFLTSVNDNGLIAGTRYDSDFSHYAGFIWDNGTFSNVSDPADPTQTAVNGINNNVVLVGNQDDSGKGFRATGCQP